MAATMTFDYAVRAAEHSNLWLAPEEALRHYQAALEALDLQESPDPRRRCELLITLAETAWSAGEPRRARDASSSTASRSRGCDPISCCGAGSRTCRRGASSSRR